MITLKKKLIKYLVKKGHSVLDCGCSTDFSVDYPIYAIDLANKVKDNEAIIKAHQIEKDYMQNFERKVLGIFQYTWRERTGG